MLTTLYIENVAVIEKVEINLRDGLNIFTGETGAGKSIMINAINAILGGRVSKEIIRSGTDSAFISATFENISKEACSVIKKVGLNLEDDGSIVIQREISTNGKSSAKFNGRPIPISILKQIGIYLVNIHGQHDNYELFSPEKHLSFLDKFANTQSELDEYVAEFEKLKNLKAQIDDLSDDEDNKQYRLDILKHHINEIESANLVPDEEEKLVNQKNFYKNQELIARTLDGAHTAINGADESPGALSILEISYNNLHNIENIYPESHDLSDRLHDLIYELQDLGTQIQPPDISDTNASAELENIEERLTMISELKRKYGASIDDILSECEKFKTELKNIELSDEKLNEALEQFEIVKESVKRLAQKLSQKRATYAKIFSQKIKNELLYLDMPKIELTVSQTRCKLNSSGCDEVEFLLSTNPGEPPRPLSKIASGGELSRIMLAIKNVLSHIEDANTMIFDEIDSGISGSAAQKVGIKLKTIAKTKQVICVTHLPQIAALADHHFVIEKNVVNERTYTNIRALNMDERKHEIARIIGGLTITDLTLKHAEEMIHQKI